MTKKVEIKYKEFIRLTWLFIIGGFISFALGLTKFLFMSPRIGINLKTQHPVVLDGSLMIILGLIFFFLGIYRIKNKKKAFLDELITENKIKEIEEKKRKKTMGY